MMARNKTLRKSPGLLTIFSRFSSHPAHPSTARTNLLAMKRSALLVAAAAFAVTVVPTTLAAVPDHLISSLPNQSIAMLSNHYSGYLEIDSGLFVHYYLVESENDVKTDPLVFWTNGVSASNLLSFYELASCVWKACTTTLFSTVVGSVSQSYGIDSACIRY